LGTEKDAEHEESGLIHLSTINLKLLLPERQKGVRVSSILEARKERSELGAGCRLRQMGRVDESLSRSGGGGPEMILASAE